MYSMIESVCTSRSIPMTDEDCEIWVRILLGVGFRVMNSRTGYNIFDRSLVMDRKDATLMFSRTHAGRDACRVL